MIHDAETLVDPIADDVSAELDAMREVGAALARVRDPHARARVLRWAAERFHTPIAAAAALTAPPIATPALVDDPTLAVEALHELFDARVEDDLHEMLEVPESVGASNRREAAGIRRQSAGRWNQSAAGRSLEPAGSRPASREEPARLDALVRGFAAEFQRLAIEWQRA